MLFSKDIKVWVYKESSDMRKSINGLSQLVVDNFEENLQSGDVFVFYNKSIKTVKILFWHYNGFMLLQKKLEKNRFKIPKSVLTNICITERQLYQLLEGMHFANITDEKYDTFC